MTLYESLSFAESQALHRPTLQASRITCSALEFVIHLRATLVCLQSLQSVAERTSVLPSSHSPNPQAVPHMQWPLDKCLLDD